MIDARTAILARARDAIARSQRGPARPVPRDYIRVGEHAPGSGPVRTRLAKPGPREVPGPGRIRGRLA